MTNIKSTSCMWNTYTFGLFLRVSSDNGFACFLVEHSSCSFSSVGKVFFTGSKIENKMERNMCTLGRQAIEDNVKREEVKLTF